MLYTSSYLAGVMWLCLRFSPLYPLSSELVISLDPMRLVRGCPDLACFVDWHLDGPINHAGSRPFKLWLMLHKYPTDAHVEAADLTNAGARESDLRRRLQHVRTQHRPRPLANFSNLVIAPLHGLQELCGMLRKREDEGEVMGAEGGTDAALAPSGAEGGTACKVDGETADPFSGVLPNVEGGSSDPLADDKSEEAARTAWVRARTESATASTPATTDDFDAFRFQHSIALNAVACTVVANPGDLLLFHPDVYHRTQDMGVQRVALQLDAL